jgi:hypothetical protein
LHSLQLAQRLAELLAVIDVADRHRKRGVERAAFMPPIFLRQGHADQTGLAQSAAELRVIHLPAVSTTGDVAIGHMLADNSAHLLTEGSRAWGHFKRLDRECLH